MVDKNPYEKDEVNVPNFGETEEKGSEPIFNMDTTSVIPETDAFSVEEEAESSSKTAIIVLIVFLVIFLVGAVAGLLFGISKNSEVARVKEEYDAYKVKTQKQITEYETQISTLQLELEQSKSNSNEGSADGTGEKTEANTYYKITDGVKVRTGAGTSFSIVDYDKLPADIKDLVLYDKASKSVTTKSAKFPVYETKEADGHTWGRIADGAWACIDKDLATKQ